MQSTRIALVSSAAALALVLTACGSDDENDGAAASASARGAATSSPDAPSGAASPSETDRVTTDKPGTNPPVDSAEFPTTEPGTGLKVGQSAVIPFEEDEKQGVLQVTVTAIEKGTIDDLTAANVKVKDEQKSSTPYYVRATFKNVSNTDLSDTSLIVPLRGLDQAGRDLGFITVLGTFKKCQRPDAEDFTNGAEVSGCRLILAPAGTTVASATFEFPRKSSDEPVTWKP